MSYCSWCGERGHNSASCTDRKKWLAANPDTYEAAYEARKVARRKARKQTPRKCGFCKKTGHNIKTCSIKEDIYRKFTTLNSVFRRVVLEQLCVQGLGVGALVKFHPHNRTDEPIVSIVREINWDNIHAGSDGRSYVIGLDRIGPVPEGYRRSIHPRSLGMRHLTHLLSKPMMGEIYQRKDVWERFEWQGGREMEVVSPVRAEAINPPADWLSGEISTRVPSHNNPLTTDNKAAALWELKQSEMSHWAYYSGVLGMKENEKYFESFL